MDGKMQKCKVQRNLLYNSKLSVNIPLEYLVSLYALVVTDRDASAVDKTYAGTPAETEQLDEQHHLDSHSGFQFNEAVIGELVGE